MSYWKLSCFMGCGPKALAAELATKAEAGEIPVGYEIEKEGENERV